MCLSLRCWAKAASIAASVPAAAVSRFARAQRSVPSPRGARERPERRSSAPQAAQTASATAPTPLLPLALHLRGSVRDVSAGAAAAPLQQRSRGLACAAAGLQIGPASPRVPAVACSSRRLGPRRAGQALWPLPATDSAEQPLQLPCLPNATPPGRRRSQRAARRAWQPSLDRAAPDRRSSRGAGHRIHPAFSRPLAGPNLPDGSSSCRHLMQLTRLRAGPHVRSRASGVACSPKQGPSAAPRG
jgi:hypothetical protein